MTIYFEGNGKSKAVTESQARDQLMLAIKNKRDEVLAIPNLDSYEDPTQRDRVVANAMVSGVLAVLDGTTDDFPSVNLLPNCLEEEYQEALDAGADYFDNGGGDIGGGSLAAYWDMISS